MAGTKKLKVGILTFWWSNDNYGQLLQCYALQKYLRDAGHDAFLIRYNSQNDFTRSPVFIRLLKALNPILLFKYLNYRVNSRKSIVEAKLHDRHFEDFRNKYIVQSEKIYSSYSELKENPPEADVYIAGSDQVWNFSFCKNIKKCKNLIHAYFLDFGKSETKRMSYAASWSCSDLYPDIIEEIRPLIAKFDYVSVREKGGIELCRKCGYENAELVPDPTLLLSAEDYRKIYSENKINVPYKPYLLLYMLSNACDFDIDNVYDFAAEKNLDVIYVTGNSKIDSYTKTFATIPEWLYLVDNAEYVVTNSFHCCVFSLILKKKFGVVPLIGKVFSMNERIENLFRLFGIKGRWIKNGFEFLENDYEGNVFSNINNKDFRRIIMEKTAVPDKLYHYTSKTGFLGIIKNKTLWASEILFMNDSKESKIPYEIFEELLSLEKNSDVKEKLKKENVTFDFNDFYKSFEGFGYYVISFSEKKDDLNQWRLYGDNASGICIEFDTSYLLETLNKCNQNKIDLKKCIYNKNEQILEIQKLIDSIKSENTPIYSIIPKLLKFSTYFKHESFKDEQEWRIVIENVEKAQKNARCGKNLFIPYCEVKIEKEKLPVEDENRYPWLGNITLGPCNDELAKNSANQVCLLNGIGFSKNLHRDLLKSDIPYRG